MTILSILSLVWGGFKSGLAAAWSFFSKPPGLYVGLALLLILGGWLYGNHRYNQGAIDAQHKEQALDAAARQQAIAGALAKQKFLDAGLITAADNAGFLRGKAQARTITITKEIPTYVTEKTDAAFPVPCGLVRLHDAAALSADPASFDNPSGLADGDSCPVTASALAGVIVSNYGLYHQAEAQIAGLQDLARTLAAAAADKVDIQKSAQ